MHPLRSLWEWCIIVRWTPLVYLDILGPLRMLNCFKMAKKLYAGLIFIMFRLWLIYPTHFLAHLSHWLTVS